MSVNSYHELKQHVGHNVECVGYGPITDNFWNVAVECADCGVVLLDFDHDRLAPFDEGNVVAEGFSDDARIVHGDDTEEEA